MKEPILASIKFDTSELDKKIDELKSLFLENIREDFLSVIADLSKNIVFTDNPATRSADGAVDILYFLDFDTVAYNKVIMAIRALKRNLTHNDNSPLHGKSPEEILEHFKKYNFV
ncbi:hypothetical protein KKJ09_22210, partial [Xenorhabdus bovienii]